MHVHVTSCLAAPAQQRRHHEFCEPPDFLAMHTSRGSVSPEPICHVLGPLKQCHMYSEFSHQYVVDKNVEAKTFLDG